MSTRDFLSPDLAAAEAEWRSPLARALARRPLGVEDVSRTGVLEVRGAVEALEADAEVVRLTSERALVLCDPARTATVRERLRDHFFVVDVSAAYAGLRIQGRTLMRRLTDLDLVDLPAVGALAHVQALVVRDDDQTFRIFVPQEYGHYVAEVVADAVDGVGAR